MIRVYNIAEILSSILNLIKTSQEAVSTINLIENLEWKSVESSFIAVDAFSKFMENTSKYKIVFFLPSS